MSRRICLPLLVLALVAPLDGCYILGYHHNNSIAVTMPFHAHQEDIVSWAVLAEAATPTGVPQAQVSDFIAYYPLPTGFTLVGVAETNWLVAPPTLPPEVELTRRWRDQLGTAAATGTMALPRIGGVVVDFQWYTIDGTQGGLVTTQLLVLGPDGRVAFEGALTTRGRTASPAALVRAHVAAWLQDVRLIKALKGGA
jgi:hypothetical protein